MLYTVSPRNRFRGCGDLAILRGNGDGTATVIKSTNCKGCSVHNAGHQYWLKVGMTFKISDVLDWEDYQYPCVSCGFEICPYNEVTRCRLWKKRIKEAI
jgi:hypothetical protein